MNWSRSWLQVCCLALAAQLLLPAAGLAKLYTWTDRNGVVRRTYYPPPPDQVWKERPAQKKAAARQTVRKNQVELYVTDWCPYCKQAIKYFQAKGVALKIYDIEKDSGAAARKKKLDSRGGVPFAVVNGQKIHGYSPDRYAAALR